MINCEISTDGLLLNLIRAVLVSYTCGLHDMLLCVWTYAGLQAEDGTGLGYGQSQTPVIL